MGGNFSRLYTRSTGGTISGPNDDAEFDNVITNFTPAGLDDYSTNTAQMQSTADPYPGAVESLATTGSGELERLRYVIKQITGEAQWYIDPDTDIATTKLHIDSLNAHYAYAAKTTTYTLTATDHIIAADGTSAAFTVTLPTAVGITGKEYILIKIDASANAITIDGNGSETINGQATYSLITQWDSIILRSNGANWISPARYSQTPTIADLTNATHTHANAAGGGNLTQSALATSVLGSVLHVREEQTSGTAGGTFTSGSYVTRVLNTEKTNAITGASLASNQMTLPAGTYTIHACAPAYLVGGHKAKLYNVTDASDTLIGTTSKDTSDDTVDQGNNDFSHIRGVFTIAAQKVFEIRHRCSSTRSTAGLGYAASFGDAEVYTDVIIQKIA